MHIITLIVQLGLVLVAGYCAVMALHTWIMDRRNERQLAREFAAELYARNVVCDRILEGFYCDKPLTDIATDIEFLKMRYFINQ
jgi:predicted protein tyrosine phosphatase